MEFAQSQDYHRPSSRLSTDQKPTSSSFFDDLDLADDSLESNMISPATTDDRRGSFGNNTAPVFSPQSTIWDDFSTTSMPERQFNVTANPFSEHSNNPFIRPDSSAFGQHSSQWPPMFDHHSESRTPIMPATYEPFNGEFDAPTPAFPHVASASPAFGNMAPNVRPASVFPSAPTPASLPTSPPPSKDWMAMAEQGAMDSRPLPKRMRQNSPPRSYSSFSRGDGIRKKNARFDIPPERSLANIDQLIQNSHDDSEIRELKQQKRLLRNRQAALDSRQRKKLRAEELENENKKWTDQIRLLEDEMQKMALQIEQHVHEKDNLMRDRVQLQEQIQELTWDKENMVQEHTLETGELRKRIGILTERLDEAVSAPSQPGSADYSDFTNEMNGLNMDTNDWDFLDFGMDSGAHDQKPQETSLVLAPKKKDSEEDKPIASGFLMLLLLCGAWVATKSTSSSSPSIPLPQLSDEVRATSALVFNNIMKDAGLPASQPSASALEPIVSSAPQARHVSFGSAAFAPPIQNSDRLGAMSNQLVNPTKDQEAEAAFSLSVAQYDSLTSTDIPRRLYTSAHDDETMSGTRRRGLADTLKEMSDQAKGDSAANVYTRSLLWDRIPTEIMQEFQRMVEESNTAAGVAGGGE